MTDAARRPDWRSDDPAALILGLLDFYRDVIAGKLTGLGGRRTTELVTAGMLTDRAAIGGRFTAERPPPALSWIVLHVLQEYARHAGHLDIVRELVDGSVGEDG